MPEVPDRPSMGYGRPGGWLGCVTASFRAAMYMPAVAALIGLWMAGCAQVQDKPRTDEATPPPVAEDSARSADVIFPSYVTPEIRDAYEFALANPDKLRYMPCYCGCGLNIGHKSNLDCYITGLEQDGTVAFTDHAVHCDVCVEITRDTRRLSAEGKSLREIRAYVDEAHGQKGPGTDTPMPPS